MKRLHVALLTGLMIFSLTACGKKDTGVIINAGDISTSSESNVVVKDNTEQKESTENVGIKNNTENTEQVGTKNNTVNNKNDSKEINLLGIWCSNNPDENIVYNFDNENKFSLYQGNTDTYIFGTYETDNETYVDIITEKKNEGDTAEVNEVDENGYAAESSESVEDNVETETQRFSIKHSTFTNEYEQTFEMITLNKDNNEIQLIKTVIIEEKTNNELEKEEQRYEAESAEE